LQGAATAVIVESDESEWKGNLLLFTLGGRESN